MKRVTLLVPDNTVSLIVAHLAVKGGQTINMRQITISTEKINSEPVIDIEKDFLKEDSQ